MKITLYQRIEIKDKPESAKRFKKTIESSIVPHVGDKYYEDGFGEPCYSNVKQVVVNYENEEYHVILQKGVISKKNSEKLIDHCESFITHGWSLNRDSTL